MYRSRLRRRHPALTTVAGPEALPIVALSLTAIQLYAVPPAPATASPTSATTTAADAAATVALIEVESDAVTETMPPAEIVSLAVPPLEILAETWSGCSVGFAAVGGA